MTEKNYTGHLVEDLLHDQEFVSTVKRINKSEEWEQFLQTQIESRNNMIQARKIIQLFQTNEEIPPYERKHKLWKNIYRFMLNIPEIIIVLS